MRLKMITEYKIATPEDINRFDCKSHIVVGDEGCIFRAMDRKIINCVEKACAIGMDIRYITPIVPYKYTNELRDIIIKLANLKPIKVTFNDYGMLYSSLDLINEGIIIPVLGRILTRSIIDCPWYDRILIDEEIVVRNALIGSTFSHSSKIELLKKFNIDEIEINEYAPAFISELKTYGLGIAVRLDGFLISTGRVCYTAYWNKFDIGQCQEHFACEENINIHLHKKWSKSRKMLSLPSTEDKDYYKNIYVKGNQVFFKIPSKPVLDHQYIDSLIIELNNN